VSRVLSVVLMGRETGSLHLLTPLLLTGGKGADLVIRGNVVQHQQGEATIGLRIGSGDSLRVALGSKLSGPLMIHEQRQSSQQATLLICTRN
jgi:hypothetical protein